jgi:putative ABC transport system permease protein
MEEEMRFHLESRAERNRAEGMDGDEANYAARRRFGNAPLLEEKSREAWGWSALDHLAQDVKFAVRSLGRNPFFVVVVVLTLAFGIGVNTAIFSAVNVLLLNPYPFPQPERILSVDARHISGKNSNTGYRDFLDWQQQNSVFDAMAISPETGGYTLTGQGEPQRMTGGATTADFLRVLGVQPVVGAIQWRCRCCGAHNDLERAGLHGDWRASARLCLPRHRDLRVFHGARREFLE